MNNKFWKLIFVTLAAAAIFMLGCSDDDDDDGNGTTPPRIVGVWDADAATETELGIDQLTYYFYSDYTYRYYRIAPPLIDERGDFTLVGLDSVEFHATWRDSVTVNETYTWRYDIVEGATQASDVLHMWLFLDPGYLEGILPRTQ